VHECNLKFIDLGRSAYVVGAFVFCVFKLCATIPSYVYTFSIYSSALVIDKLPRILTTFSVIELTMQQKEGYTNVSYLD